MADLIGEGASPRTRTGARGFMAEDSELFARSSARLGTTLRGKYRLDRVLGIGGMAVVFAATHRNQKQFAVKMLHPELSLREDIRTRFLREGYAANSLRHPGAVAVLDDDVSEDGAAFLVMELLEGDGLESLWEKAGRRISPRAVLAIGYQLLDVLAAAHAKGIVHRDIKPPNLFLTEDGTLKVLDFGIARVRDAVAGVSQATGTGMLLGTPAFMAPEQALAKSSDIDGQTDVWAAGATLFTLLSGELVHLGDNGPQLMIKAATTPARSVTTVAPGTPAGVVQIVDRALAFDKAARWPSAVAMRDAIRDTHVAMYGEAVSRAPLVGLLHGQVEPPATQHARPLASAPVWAQETPEAPAPRSAVALSPSAESIDPNRAAAPTGPTTNAPSTASLPGGTLPAGATPVGPYTPGSTVGMSTSKPVSSEPLETPRGVPSRKSTSLVIAAIAVGAIVVIAFATFEFSGRSAAVGATATRSADSPPVAATSGTTAPPPPAISPPPPATATASAAAVMVPDAGGIGASAAITGGVGASTPTAKAQAPTSPVAKPAAPKPSATPPPPPTKSKTYDHM